MGFSWSGKRPKKKGWKSARKKFVVAECEHCGAQLNRHGIGSPCKAIALRFGGAVDHIVPERLALLTKKNPHDPVNLMCLARPCHGIKTVADWHLCRGDKAKFLEILRKYNWPMERVEAALTFYGL
jgi:5-methylcytosine-specific restriction endonuclease McrA